MSRLYLLLLLLLLPGIASPATSSRQRQLDQLRHRIGHLRDTVERASADRAEAADGLRASERKISDVNRALYQLRQKEQKLNTNLSGLAREHDATEARLHTEQHQLAVLLRQRYSQGGDDATRLLMSGRNPGEVQRDLEYYAYIGRARAKLIAAHKATLAHLAEVEAETRARKNDLSQLKQKQLAQRTALSHEKRIHQTVYDKLSKQIRKQRKQIGYMVRDEARLTRLIKRLQRLAAERQKNRHRREPGRGEKVNQVVDASLAKYKFTALKGRLALPVAGVIVDRFGQRRPGGGPSWKGLFIRAKEGQPVRAVGNGKVVFADWLRGFGNLLIIDHGHGYLSLYSDNESLYKQVGDHVRAGDIIATVGNTGGQEDPGLYFELRHLGRPFDPMKWVR